MPTSGSAGHPFDLHDAARRAALAGDFEITLPPAAAQQLASIEAAPASSSATSTDLRALLWSSIDDDRSRDLDQIEVAAPAANDGIRVQVGIADVDGLVPRGSPLDAHAAHNATTLYTGIETFPMLPIELSTDRTSLVPDADRPAIVIAFTVAPDGSTTDPSLAYALVRNHAQLAYDSVSQWLVGEGAPPPAVTKQQGLADQLHLQHTAAERLLARRAQRGALDLETIESVPVISADNGVDLQLVHAGPARDLIEDFMIAANSVIASQFAARGRACIRRVVRTPARWDRIVALAKTFGTALPATPDPHALAAFLNVRRAADPQRFPDLSLSVIKLLGPGQYVVDAPGTPSSGHFGLAVDDYTHGTAPNRRYADLIVQRLIKAMLTGGAPPYSESELATLAAHCTEQEDNARRVARLVHKQSAAVMLGTRVGTNFDAIVTGVTDHGTFARLLAPPVEGRIMNTNGALDVGDCVRVRLVHTDPEKGYIDLATDGR